MRFLSFFSKNLNFFPRKIQNKSINFLEFNKGNYDNKPTNKVIASYNDFNNYCINRSKNNEQPISGFLQLFGDIKRISQ